MRRTGSSLSWARVACVSALFSLTASQVYTCPRILFKNPTHPPAGKDNILRLLHTRIDQSFIDLTELESTILHGTMQLNQPFSSLIFTTTVYYISRMVSKGCTRVQYTAREYTENCMSAVMKRGGGAGFFPPKDNIRLHGGETFEAGPVRRFNHQQRYLTGKRFFHLAVLELNK
jgi:hypothetical protein